MYTYTNSGCQDLPGMALARLELGARNVRDPDHSIPHPVAANGGLRDRGGNGLGSHLPFLWKGPERRRMVMIMRTWHRPTRTFLPSQVRGLLRGWVEEWVVCSLGKAGSPGHTGWALAGHYRRAVSLPCTQLMQGSMRAGVPVSPSCP